MARGSARAEARASSIPLDLRSPLRGHGLPYPCQLAVEQAHGLAQHPGLAQHGGAHRGLAVHQRGTPAGKRTHKRAVVHHSPVWHTQARRTPAWHTCRQAHAQARCSQSWNTQVRCSPAQHTCRQARTQTCMLAALVHWGLAAHLPWHTCSHAQTHVRHACWLRLSNWGLAVHRRSTLACQTINPTRARTHTHTHANTCLQGMCVTLGLLRTPM